MTNIEIGTQMIEQQDWYYDFVEVGWSAARAAAYNSMRAFVNFLNTKCNKDEATTLRDMWMDAYKSAQASKMIW